ncbi:hypothetical protein Lser_V15G29330 [Lactuca serriola]
MCSSKEPPAETGLTSKAFESLKIGSTTIIVEAPKMLKTTTSLPCLRVNSVLVKADDVGRLVKGSHTSHTIIIVIESIEIFEIVRAEANTSIDKSFAEIEEFFSVGMAIQVFHSSIHGVELGDE